MNSRSLHCFELLIALNKQPLQFSDSRAQMCDFRTVDRSEVAHLRTRITELERLLVERDQQLKAMQATGVHGASDLLGLAGELRSMFSRSTDELLARVDD